MQEVKNGDICFFPRGEDQIHIFSQVELDLMTPSETLGLWSAYYVLWTFW